MAGAAILYRLTTPPGASPLLDEPLLHPQPAMYAALVGAALITAAALHASMAGDPAPKQVEQPDWAKPGEIKVWDAS